MKTPVQNHRAYIVTVDMGYGHQRAVYPLRNFGLVPKSKEPGLITANIYPGIPRHDTARWQGGRKLYETISRMKSLPLIGESIFGIMDYVQRIEPFYPRRDLSVPTAQVKQIYRMIRRGWGKHLIDLLNKKPLPYITSFFTTAFFAEEHGNKGDIYCLCTDTDVSRAWAPLSPDKSRIQYFAPNKRVKERLIQYGVKEKQIFVTGFPLPEELLGPREKVLKESLGCRIQNLDPRGVYQTKYHQLLDTYFGKQYAHCKTHHPLTITFAVGGAGAQREIGASILKSLRNDIYAGRIRLNLVAGNRQDVYEYYDRVVKGLHFNQEHKGSVHILYSPDKYRYFSLFNEVLKTTDILWTKPSELSFYAGIGLPIIMSPTVGSQEAFNREWLLSIGAGFDQQDPAYTHEWLFDWLNSGSLAEAAMKGYLDAPKQATKHIEDIVFRGKRSEIKEVHLL